MRKYVEKEIPRIIQVPAGISCDLCGYNEDETYVFPVSATVDEGGCVGTRITRDVCQDCYEEKLQEAFDNLFIALKAGEDEELADYHEDRWYG